MYMIIQIIINLRINIYIYTYKYIQRYMAIDMYIAHVFICTARINNTLPIWLTVATVKVTGHEQITSIFFGFLITHERLPKNMQESEHFSFSPFDCHVQFIITR